MEKVALIDLGSNTARLVIYDVLDGGYFVVSERTSESVRKFQNVFGLPETGITDYPTWYKIQEIYVAVSRIAELN